MVACRSGDGARQAHTTLPPGFQDRNRLPRSPRGTAQRVPDSEHDSGHPIGADLDRERIHRKPVLSGLISE